MATFVHLIDARDARKITRNGIRPSKVFNGTKVVFCVPVVPNFQITFQWLRELRRFGHRTMSAAQFRIADSEKVHVGRFTLTKDEMTAAEAVAYFQKTGTPYGLEVWITRTIRPVEIMHIRPLPQITGWRFHPEAKGRQPLWPNRGAVKAARLRRTIREKNKSPLEALLDPE